MSKFDERILKPSSDMFYFQIIPKQFINISHADSSHPRTINQITKGISFKLYKGNHQCILGDQLCDQSKSVLPIFVGNGDVQIRKSYINFNVTKYRADCIVQFVIKVCSYADKEREKEKDNMNQGKNENLEETQNGHYVKSNLKKEEVGKFTIMSNYYIAEYLNNGKRDFHESVKINGQFSFEFHMFIQKSRFGLQKYIREYKDIKKEGFSRRNLMEDLRRSDMRFQLQLRRPMINSPKSQIISEITENQIFSVGDNKFICPSRRIIKDKKLLVRNSSARKSNMTITQQGKSIGDTQSIEKKQANRGRSLTNKKSRSKNEDDESEDEDGDNNNFLRVQNDKIKKSLELLQLAQDVDKLSNSHKNNQEGSEDFFEFPERELSQRSKITSKNNNWSHDYLGDKANSQRQRSYSKISAKLLPKLDSGSQKSSTSKFKVKIKSPLSSPNSKNPKQQQIPALKPTNINVFMNFTSGKLFIILFSLISIVILTSVMTPNKKM